MSDDWLSKLALKYLGDANRWPEIYGTNQAVIEAVAREHPGPPVSGSSDHGHWIFPGTALTIPGASCAPATPPTTSTTPTTGGGVTDQQACEAVGGIPAETQSGDFYCGKFNTLSAPAPPLTPGELDQLEFAGDTVGCLKDIASLAGGPLTGALSRAGFTVVQRVLLLDKIVTVIRDAGSGNESLIVWDAAEASAEAIGGTGTSCVKLFFNRAIASLG